MKLTTNQKNKLIVEKYLARNKKYEPYIKVSPPKGLFNIVVIPAYNEPDILKTLQSLLECNEPEFPVEVIVVVNSKQGDSPEIIMRNELTYRDVSDFALKNNNVKIKFYPLLFANLPLKQAGAGLARKIGMDEALLRYKIVGQYNVITSLDADTIVEKNYLQEIESLFLKSDTELACVYYEHAICGNEYPGKIYNAIIKYELYLRYYYQALKYINFPFAYHTVGSAFVVNSLSYAKYGGMSPKQAGEDFYFIQKVARGGLVTEMNTTCVYPSSRVSDRVVFGTGPAIADISENNSYFVYDLQSIIDIGKFVKEISVLFGITKNEYNLFVKKMPESVQKYLFVNNFFDKLNKINKNTNSIKSFKKAFFTIFDAFSLIKFLNDSHFAGYYKKKSVETQASVLLKRISGKEIYGAKDLLLFYRGLEKG